MKKTVLIVDQDDGLRSLLKRALVANNFNVAEASDGTEALEAVERYSPDLVLLDFGLPKVSGETVCVEIKKDHPEIIVIALTEKKQSSDVVHGLQIGADDFISKPFVADELLARIHTRLKTIPSEPTTPKNPEVEIQSKTSDESELGKMVFRESVVMIVFRLISAEIIFGLSFLLLSFLSSYLNQYIKTSSIMGFFFLIFMGGLAFNILFVCVIVLKWATEYTEVFKEGVIKHSGILHIKEQRFACNFVEAVKLEQSFFGLLFNYGTIELYDPALKEKVYLLNISSPKESRDRMQQVISKGDEQSIPFVTDQDDQS